MKRIRKQGIALLLVLGLLLSSCGAPSSNTPKEETQKTEITSEEKQPVEKVQYKEEQKEEPSAETAPDTKTTEDPKVIPVEIINEQPIDALEDPPKPEEEQPEIIASAEIEGVIPDDTKENENQDNNPLEIPVDGTINTQKEELPFDVEKYTAESVPDISNIVGAISTDSAIEPYIIVNNNIPYFTDAEKVTESFQYYSSFDELGRVGTAYANLHKSLMPSEARGSLNNLRPSGWHLIRYDDVIADKYLFNRCHLIGYQLTGCNDARNIMTGTRYFNVEGMLHFENKVASYLKSTDNHVLYRVSPAFEGNNLLAYGVLIEAFSVEDNGTGICFNVFLYNIQPNIDIDYETGESELSEDYLINPLLLIPAIAAGIEIGNNDRLEEIQTDKPQKIEKSKPQAVDEPKQDTIVEEQENPQEQPKTEEQNQPTQNNPVERQQNNQKDSEKSQDENKNQNHKDNSEEMVWIPTNGGKRYHCNSTCSKMKSPKLVTISEAKALGFTACGRCYQ